MVLHLNKQVCNTSVINHNVRFTCFWVVSLLTIRFVFKSTKCCQYGCLGFLLRQWCNHHDHLFVSMLEAIPHARHYVHGNRRPEPVAAGLVYLCLLHYLCHLHKWDSLYCCCKLICICLNEGLNFLLRHHTITFHYKMVQFSLRIWQCKVMHIL